VNPHLGQLQPYPFEKLRALFAGVTPNPQYREIKLSIGEPQHATPRFIMEALAGGLKGLANYPTTQGIPALRQAIAAWCRRRYGLELNPETEILPVNGSREALFSFAQTVIDPGRGHVPLVVSPNPFYQIYEGAAYLAGAEPRFLNTCRTTISPSTMARLSDREWARVQLLLRLLAGQSDRQGVFARRLESAVRAVRQIRLHHRLRRVLFGNPFRRSQPAARRRCRRRSCSGAATSGWSCSPACPSAPTCRACAPASSPATPPS
jgi:hypothetical protein